MREARNEFEAELTSDTLLCFLLTDSGMTTYEISPTIYSPVRKDLEWSLTCNKGPHFATPLPGWDRNASSTDVMGYQDRTRYDGRPHYIIHNPGEGISRSGTFADVCFAPCTTDSITDNLETSKTTQTAWRSAMFWQYSRNAYPKRCGAKVGWSGTHSMTRQCNCNAYCT